jgi:hypothetical protein
MIPSGRGDIGSILASELAGTNDGGSMLEQEELWPALGGTLSISFEVRERKNFAWHQIPLVQKCYFTCLMRFN